LFESALGMLPNLDWLTRLVKPKLNVVVATAHAAGFVTLTVSSCNFTT